MTEYLENKDVRELYRQLIEATKKTECKTVSKFFPVEGVKYKESREKNDANVRLMFIGRAPNSWADCDLNDSLDKFLTGVPTNFEWLNDNGVTKRGDILSNKAFWYCTKATLEEIDPKIKGKTRWFDYTCWSNLYPISPIEGGNPEGDLKEVQLSSARGILESQIEYFKPTHILFITDWAIYDRTGCRTWFSDFAELFTDINGKGAICEIAGLDAEDAKIDDKRPVVVAKGKYKNIPVVVTSRPDKGKQNRPTADSFARQVKDAFDEIANVR